MEHPGVTILNANRTMSISTSRADGWSQTTIVGYANAGFDIYFLIFRTSQKFRNIERDRRISLAIGHEPEDLAKLQAVYAGAFASEVTEPKQRDLAWKLLSERHPNLNNFELPNESETALMHAACKYVSVLDYTQGPGHTETLTLSGDEAPPVRARGVDAWGAAVSGE